MRSIENFPTINVNKSHALSIDKFREMDYLSIEKYDYPIEEMMENAGLSLARLVASMAEKKSKILVGVGKGNNGGGGLVAARRLVNWGFDLTVHLPDTNLNPIAAKQLKRARLSGVKEGWIAEADYFIDAYFGFSQRLPLPKIYTEALDEIQKSSALSISLDIPTSFDSGKKIMPFVPDHILTLAAMKTELLPFLDQINIWVADLGLSEKIYREFGSEQISTFQVSSLVKIIS